MPSTTSRQTIPAADDLVVLVNAAAQGDAQAWNKIVDRFTRLLWSVARSYRLNDSDAADVVQMTWLRLLDNVNRIDSPQGLPKWLSTTAQREALAIIKKRRREVLVDDSDEVISIESGHGSEVDVDFLTSERDEHLRACLDTLAPRNQRLLHALVATRRPQYAEIAATLDMPIGSIGPTRMRTLDQLHTAMLTSGYPFEGRRTGATPAPSPHGRHVSSATSRTRSVRTPPG
jgi:RNA polymerase sigma factor (sigma-70 family)